MYRCLFFLFLFLSACVDEVTLPTPDQPETGILLQGNFAAGVPARVEASMFELYQLRDNLPRALTGAIIVIEHESGQTARLNNFSSGKFAINLTESFPDFPVQTGARYRLVATLPSGKTYQSEWEELLEPPVLDSIYIDTLTRPTINAQSLIEQEPYFSFCINSSLLLPGSGKKAYLLWEMSHSYLLTDNQQRTCAAFRPLLNTNIMIVNGLESNSDHLNRFPVTEVPINYFFAEGYYLVTYQHAISENAYHYFKELNQLLAKKGTLFDPPAGAIRSNITNPDQPGETTYGFFYVSKPDTLFTYIAPEKANYPRPRCPLIVNGPAPPKNSCDDCLCEPGGRLNRPYWWQ